MVLVESDSLRRDLLARGLRNAGFPVIAVGSIAELERWPADDIVLTESRQFTSWWQEVGASHVIVLAETPADGVRCCRLGATLSVARRCPLPRLLAAIDSLGVNRLAGWTAGAALPGLHRERPALVH
jgi:hypothetical protein